MVIFGINILKVSNTDIILVYYAENQFTVSAAVV